MSGPVPRHRPRFRDRAGQVTTHFGHSLASRSLTVADASMPLGARTVSRDDVLAALMRAVLTWMLAPARAVPHPGTQRHAGRPCASDTSPRDSLSVSW
jgi:hypothetical protein